MFWELERALLEWGFESTFESALPHLSTGYWLSSLQLCNLGRDATCAVHYTSWKSAENKVAPAVVGGEVTAIETQRSPSQPWTVWSTWETPSQKTLSLPLNDEWNLAKAEESPIPDKGNSKEQRHRREELLCVRPQILRLGEAGQGWLYPRDSLEGLRLGNGIMEMSILCSFLPFGLRSDCGSNTGER